MTLKMKHTSMETPAYPREDLSRTAIALNNMGIGMIKRGAPCYSAANETISDAARLIMTVIAAADPLERGKGSHVGRLPTAAELAQKIQKANMHLASAQMSAIKDSSQAMSKLEVLSEDAIFPNLACDLIGLSGITLGSPSSLDQMQDDKDDTIRVVMIDKADSDSIQDMHLETVGAIIVYNCAMCQLLRTRTTSDASAIFTLRRKAVDLLSLSEGCVSLCGGDQPNLGNIFTTNDGTADTAGAWPLSVAILICKSMIQILQEEEGGGQFLEDMKRNYMWSLTNLYITALQEYGQGELSYLFNGGQSDVAASA